MVTSLVATASARAQGLQPRFGVGASMAIPTGDYHATASGEGFNTGWQGMAFVAFRLPTRPLGFRVDLNYGANGGNDQLNNTLTTNLGRSSTEQVKLLGGNVDLTYALPSAARVRPYLLGGLGMYHITISVTSGGTSTDETATKVAWNLGGGVTYRLASVAVFLEARYVSVAAAATFPRTTFLPITAGVRVGAE
jgi:opacity protein-like surface antigen